MAGFASISPEQRIENLAKAKAAKAAKNEVRRASTLRKDWADMPEWERLASERKLRLPPHGELATVSNIRTFCHKAGVTGEQFNQWAGCTVAGFLARNPTWPARAIAGVILEEGRL